MGPVLVLAALAGGYSLEGRIVPPIRASVSLHGAVTPFSDATLADDGGRFRFKKLVAGAYTLSVFAPGRGEARRTIEVGPSTADRKGRVSVRLELTDQSFEHRALRGTAVVSAKQLAVPDRALKEYDEAQHLLARRDVPGATARLEHAVEIAPQFSNAWNTLGTIFYQTRQFHRAEECFRKSLEADPNAFEPLVNLGGVLVTLGRVEEGLQYNLYAVLARPNDSLANSQLGMSYFQAGNLDLAQKYLEAAKEIDPAHFSHPQLWLAEIHTRRNEKAAAADELEDFLQRHPDYPDAARLRESIRKLRQ